MKNLLFLTLLTIGNSCNYFVNNSTTWETQKIVLTDSLGSISLSMPKEFNFFHSWVKRSDYRCGNTYLYRYQSSIYSKEQETGWLSDAPDTLFSFTISHPIIEECCRPFLDITVEEIMINIKEMLATENKHSEADTLFSQKINGKSFVIYSLSDKFHKHGSLKELIGTTYWMDIPLQFTLRLSNLNVDHDSFFSIGMSIMQSIKLMDK